MGGNPRPLGQDWLNLEELFNKATGRNQDCNRNDKADCLGVISPETSLERDLRLDVKVSTTG